MNWSQRPAYTSLELFLVYERRNVITPLAAHPTAAAAAVAVGCAWPAIVGGGGLGQVPRSTSFFRVGGGGGLGRAPRRMTFLPVDGGGGGDVRMARKTILFPVVGGGGLRLARCTTLLPIDGGGLEIPRQDDLCPGRRRRWGGRGPEDDHLPGRRRRWAGMVPRSTSFFLVGSGARLCRARRRPHLPLDVKFHRSSVRPRTQEADGANRQKPWRGRSRVHCNAASSACSTE